MRKRLATGGLILWALMLAAPAFAQPAATCGDLTTLSAEQQTAARNAATTAGSDFGAFSCQNVSGVDATARAQNCVSGLCPGSSSVMCCSPGIGGREGTAGADGAVTTGGGGGFFRLELPSCTVDGDCTVDDIVRTGVNFANFLFGISGAILLATFVYGGVLYITAGSGGNVQKAKDMIKNALIGMILVFGAGALVTTVYDTFRSDTSGRSDTCAAAHPSYACQTLDANPADATAVQAEITDRGCFRDLCAGSETRVCCPQTTP